MQRTRRFFTRVSEAWYSATKSTRIRGWVLNILTELGLLQEVSWALSRVRGLLSVKVKAEATKSGAARIPLRARAKLTLARINTRRSSRTPTREAACRFSTDHTNGGISKFGCGKTSPPAASSQSDETSAVNLVRPCIKMQPLMLEPERPA